MRIYIPADLGDVKELAAGGLLRKERIVPVAEDEDAEFEAFSRAGALGPAVVSAEVDAPDAPVGLSQVVSFHVDEDGSGDLAWYATQEVDQVLLILRGN